MRMPAIDMRRVYLIARRDFLGYIKTWGFWISFFLPFVFGALGYFMTTLDLNVEPVRYEVILDETGKHEAGILETFKRQNGLEDVPQIASLAATLKPEEGVKTSKTVFIAPPAPTMEGLQAYLKQEKLLSKDGKNVPLDAVLHIYERGNALNVNYWSPNINSQDLKRAAQRYFRDRATQNYLSTGGLTQQGLRDAQKARVSIGSFDPTKDAASGADGQAVTDTDMVPFFVSVILSMILWLTIFSGSYMLLTSMLEEKLNKLMEMMLASTRFSEIMLGKLIGVAALTIAAMSPYLIVGFGSAFWLIFNGPPEIAAGLTQAFTPKLVIFFIVFLLLGYVFYGSFFIAMGALAESMQDAQTLTTPIMLILTSCVLVVPLGLNSPDSPLLKFASWFPLSSPFASIARLPSDPPWWELTLSALILFVVSMGVIMLAGRVFQYGVLSGAGVKGVKSWFARVIFRRKAA